MSADGGRVERAAARGIGLLFVGLSGNNGPGTDPETTQGPVQNMVREGVQGCWIGFPVVTGVYSRSQMKPVDGSRTSYHDQAGFW